MKSSYRWRRFLSNVRTKPTLQEVVVSGFENNDITSYQPSIINWEVSVIIMDDAAAGWPDGSV